jgi:hypothetical protein
VEDLITNDIAVVEPVASYVQQETMRLTKFQYTACTHLLQWLQ